eukprot:186728-Karenia_brevis.AAC.1
MCPNRIWRPEGSSDLETADTMVPLCDQAAIEREAQQWAALWDEQGREHADDTCVPSTCPPNALKVAELRRASMSFPAGTGLGCDNVAPRAISRLSDRLLLALCVLFEAFEKIGKWPELLRLVVS